MSDTEVFKVLDALISLGTNKRQQDPSVCVCVSAPMLLRSCRPHPPQQSARTYRVTVIRWRREGERERACAFQFDYFLFDIAFKVN